MPYLTWISDEDLTSSVVHLVEVAESALEKSQKKFYRNVIDPFSALFQMAGFGIDSDVWLTAEETRQSQKTLQNHIGEFHQKILGSVEGWEDLGIGGIIDLKSEEKKIIAEVKNKHNTVTGGSLSDFYDKFAQLVMPKMSGYKGYTAYFVNIIPKRAEREDILFIPSDRQTGNRKPENELIRKIDGASFYEIVTGDKNALKDLYEVLPKVVSDKTDKAMTAEQTKVLTDLFKRAFA